MTAGGVGRPAAGITQLTDPPSPMSTTNKLVHIIHVNRETMHAAIKISLDDDCHNGHEDFSVTATIEELVDPTGHGHTQRWETTSSGCCHDRILELRPGLKPFVDLHLSTWEGIPMHCAANGFYWYAGWKQLFHVKYHGGSGRDGNSPEKCAEIFKDLIRATPEDMEFFDKAGIVDELSMRMAIEERGMPASWKAEANSAIAKLEEWTGLKFESKATKRTLEPVTEEQRTLHAERVASGWYTPEAVADRIAEAKRQAITKALGELEVDRVAAMQKIVNEYQVRRWLVVTFGGQHEGNVIYYNHTNQICANWSTTSRIIPKEEWDKITAEAPMDVLPAGVTFHWQPKPRN